MLITDPIYQNADKAREHLEKIRWPDGPICPHCGAIDQASAIKANSKAKVRKGLYFCNACREQFTVTVGTVYERSKIPLNKWILATHLMAASKTAMSAHQLHRMLGITYKTAWFMCHRIREAMRELAPGPMGGEGGQVQADETVIGNSSKRAKSYKPGIAPKQRIFAIVDPNTGEARAFHVARGEYNPLHKILRTHASRKSILVTDSAVEFRQLGGEFILHKKVFHKAFQYVTQEGFTTNNVENFFGLFKRGFKTYSHCGEQHLQRYLTEFAYRYTHRKISDTERAEKALEGIAGKRLTYRRPDESQVG
jgi:transposase-like protein